MLKYRIVCSSGCMKDVKFCDSSSHIQRIKANALKNDKKKIALPDKNSTHHTITRVRRAGAAAPKKASI